MCGGQLAESEDLWSLGSRLVELGQGRSKSTCERRSVTAIVDLCRQLLLVVSTYSMATTPAVVALSRLEARIADCLEVTGKAYARAK